MTVNSLIIINGGTGSVILGEGGYALTLASGGLLLTGDGSAGSLTPAINNGSIVFGNGTATEGFVLTGSNITSNINATLTSVLNGSGGVTFSAPGNAGEGTMTRSASLANVYSGNTALNSGTLSIGESSSLGTGGLTLTGGTLVSQAAATLPNPLNLNHSEAIIGGSNAITFVGGGTATVSATSNSPSTTTLTYQQTATVTLTGSSGSYNVTVDINGAMQTATNISFLTTNTETQNAVRRCRRPCRL